jgi:hypothetical protein
MEAILPLDLDLDHVDSQVLALVRSWLRESRDSVVYLDNRQHRLDTISLYDYMLCRMGAMYFERDHL